MELFLSSPAEFAPVVMRKLRSILANKKDKLMVELAAVIDVGGTVTKYLVRPDK